MNDDEYEDAINTIAEYRHTVEQLTTDLEDARYEAKHAADFRDAVIKDLVEFRAKIADLSAEYNGAAAAALGARKQIASLTADAHIAQREAEKTEAVATAEIARLMEALKKAREDYKSQLAAVTKERDQARRERDSAEAALRAAQPTPTNAERAERIIESCSFPSTLNVNSMLFFTTAILDEVAEMIAVAMRVGK